MAGMSRVAFSLPGAAEPYLILYNHPLSAPPHGTPALLDYSFELLRGDFCGAGSLVLSAPAPVEAGDWVQIWLPEDAPDDPSYLGLVAGEPWDEGKGTLTLDPVSSLLDGARWYGSFEAKFDDFVRHVLTHCGPLAGLTIGDIAPDLATLKAATDFEYVGDSLRAAMPVIEGGTWGVDARGRICARRPVATLTHRFPRGAAQTPPGTLTGRKNAVRFKYKRPDGSEAQFEGRNEPDIALRKIEQWADITVPARVAASLGEPFQTLNGTVQTQWALTSPGTGPVQTAAVSLPVFSSAWGGRLLDGAAATLPGGPVRVGRDLPLTSWDDARITVGLKVRDRKGRGTLGQSAQTYEQYWNRNNPDLPYRGFPPPAPSVIYGNLRLKIGGASPGTRIRITTGVGAGVTATVDDQGEIEMPNLGGSSSTSGVLAVTLEYAFSGTPPPVPAGQKGFTISSRGRIVLPGYTAWTATYDQPIGAPKPDIYWSPTYYPAVTENVDDLFLTAQQGNIAPVADLPVSLGGGPPLRVSAPLPAPPSAPAWLDDLIRPRPVTWALQPASPIVTFPSPVNFSESGSALETPVGAPAAVTARHASGVTPLTNIAAAGETPRWAAPPGSNLAPVVGVELAGSPATLGRVRLLQASDATFASYAAGLLRYLSQPVRTWTGTYNELKRVPASGMAAFDTARGDVALDVQRVTFEGAAHRVTVEAGTPVARTDGEAIVETIEGARREIRALGGK